MYLSRLFLNPRDRAVRADLADCQHLHRTVMGAFPTVGATGTARNEISVLHRVDADSRTGVISLLVQSRLEPIWTHLPSGYLTHEAGAACAVKAVDQPYAALRQGMRLFFRLRANPTRKIDTKSGPNGERRNGRRVELRDEESRLAWLQRKGEQHGFSLGTTRAFPPEPSPLMFNASGSAMDKVTGRRGTTASNTHMTFAGVTFDGELTIADESLFREALETGIGSGKAYGFGLLSVRRPRG